MADKHDTLHSSQSTDNRSFNDTYEMYEHIPYGYDSATGTVKAIAVDSDGQIKNATTEATNFAFYGSTSDATYDYVGKQSADGKWYIMRIHQTTGAATYAVGDSDMATAWANFDTQDYDVWDNHNQSTATIAEASNVTVSNPELVVIDLSHEHIHHGDSYYVNDIVTLANSASQDYIITTPAGTTHAHWGYDIESTTGGLSVYLYEDSDRVGTDDMTEFNRNRNSANTASVEVKKGQSGGTTDGTLIAQLTSGTTTAGGKLSGRTADLTERVLKADTKYLFRVTSKANSNDISVRFNWYEYQEH